ncbi:MAG: DUF2490 domain-containing protein [Bacteroidia bacterium]|nr:DUF2490 domain-containing protein [Bacteroidia bacterium]
MRYEKATTYRLSVRLFWVLGGGAFGLSQAQRPIGVWTFQQWGFGLSQSENWQGVLVSQPRFTPLGWESLILMGKLGYRFHPKHMVFGGGQWAEFYDPRRFSQLRLFQRWQWTPSLRFSLTTTLEKRWQGIQMTEILLRPLWRYRVGLGPLWLSLSNEIFFSLWTPSAGGQLNPRQVRLWIAVSFPRQNNWQLEVGYLSIITPHSILRHRLWIASRIYISVPHHLK